jgi:hypothetical protein
MSGAIPLLSYTSSWRATYLSTGITLPYLNDIMVYKSVNNLTHRSTDTNEIRLFSSRAHYF